MERNEPEGFVEFWDIWRPHRRKTDGRGLARAAYRKHILNGADPKDIADGAEWFIKTLKTPEDRAHIPLASTWLNREAYEDAAQDKRDFDRRVAEQKARAEQSNVTHMSPFERKMAANA